MIVKNSLTGDLRKGDETQSYLALQQRDIGADDFASIGQVPAVADAVAETIRRLRMFTSPEEQIKRLLEINEAVWKDTAITEAAIRALGDPLDCPASDKDGLYCVSLLADTGDPLATLVRNWAAAVHIHGQDGTWKWDGVMFVPKGARQRPEAKSRPTGLRWAVAELGRKYQNRKVRDVRPILDKGGIMGMGQELPLIAALHPRWAISMNGKDIPFVDAPDIGIAPRAVGGFSCALCLGFDPDDRRVFLSAGHLGYAGPGFGSGWFRQ